MDEFTLTMRLKKQTKGTVVYEAEDDTSPKISVLYIKKWAFPYQGTAILAPEFISVTVKEAD